MEHHSSSRGGVRNLTGILREILIVVDVPNATQIKRAVNEAKKLALTRNVIVTFAFNTLPVVVRPDSDPKEVIRYYRERIKPR